jgi:hypothetical protein
MERLNEAVLNKYGIPLRITSGQRNQPGSYHHYGRAFDATLGRPGGGRAQAPDIGKMARDFGLRFLDEFRRPSRRSTGPHMHFFR